MDQTQLCPFCSGEILSSSEETSVLTSKGCQGIFDACRKRNENIVVLPGQYVHTECRRLYVNPYQIKKATSKDNQISPNTDQIPTLRSKEQFNFPKHCFFCGCSAQCSDRKRGYDVFPVRTKDFQSQILLHCNEREDEWAIQVKGRLESINDLHAADAVYHQTCSVNFRTKKDIPKAFSPNSKTTTSKGRRSKHNDFMEVIKFLEENSDMQITLLDTVRKMEEISGDDAFSDTHMRRKLKDYFGDDIIFTKQHQKSDIITIREAMSKILKQFHGRPKLQDAETEKRSIIETAAKLIRTDILAMEPTAAVYPSAKDISSLESNLDFLPDSLLALLKKIISGKDLLKISAIGQSIVQTTRPRLILAPLQLGLGVQMHHQYGSKFLIDTLNALGFSASYSEIQRFENNAACQQGTDIPGFTNGSFIQYSADNVDHNSCTLDGKGTFHGMGIIACTTPANKSCITVPRLNVSLQDVKTSGKIETKYYQATSNIFTSLTYTELKDLNAVDNLDRFDCASSLLWIRRCPMPAWSGVMQMCHKRNYPGHSTVSFLPMIDMSASDPSCIYSTLCFVTKHAEKYGVTPIITFDQPLFWKASMIIVNEPSDSSLQTVILRLGGFHTEMNFLGCIGHIMKGTGLQEIFELVYAPNAVCHILNGKAVSRAVRAHFLMDIALHSLLVSKFFGLPLSDQIAPATENSDNLEETGEVNSLGIDQCDNGIKLIDNVNLLYNQVISADISVESFCNNPLLDQVEQHIESEKEPMKNHRTANLWMQYLQMISILKSFLRAERTGNWLLHLKTIQIMLPYFAAAGHNLYLKSVYLYLMNMQQLGQKHPQIYEMFMTGHHVLRRSDRFWAGLSSDLVIEQVLMRSLKTTGGLTRGRGMTDTQRARWLNSMPACAEINSSLQDLTDVGFTTSDQHKESSTARQLRDMKDINTMIHFLQERDPFNKDDESLRNIETGAVANKDVNVDKAEYVGRNIIKAMEGKEIHNHSFKKSNQVVTMDSKIGVKIDNEIIQVDPQLLFQRLITVAKLDNDNVSNIFKYELSSVPSSLFNADGFLREANKAQLADAIWKLGDCGIPELPACPIYVLDGGSLLQRIPWNKGESFSSTCARYLDYIRRRYDDAVIVFDGYKNGPSTKDTTHMRRSKGMLAQRIQFTEDMPCKSRKEDFLSNKENKQQFIELLGEKLTDSGYKTLYAEGDADRLIVQTAVGCTSSKDVVVIGEDTDLLILQLYYLDVNSDNELLFKSESIKGKTKIWSIKKTKNILGLELSSVLPVIHALTGCDTTSRTYGLGKGVAFKKIASNQQLLHLCKLFLGKDVERGRLMKAGEDIMVMLCGGVENENLDHLRFRRFSQKSATSTTQIQIQTLPPTSDATRFHSQRVYLQVQDWVGDFGHMKPAEWGWYCKESNLQPVMTTLRPAPENILKVIRCSCKQGCDTKRCSCLKHGLDCSIGCAECRGVSCKNSAEICPSVFEDDDMS